MANGNNTKNPEGFLDQVEAGFRKSYAGRLKKARDEQKKAENALDAERLMRAQTKEEAEKRIAEIKRGNPIDIMTVVASGVAGFVAGAATQKMADVRIGPVPVDGALGGVGVVLGLALDEEQSVRTSIVVGGSMFTLGTLAYAYFNPLPPKTEEGP